MKFDKQITSLVFGGNQWDEYTQTGACAGFNKAAFRKCQEVTLKYAAAQAFMEQNKHSQTSAARSGWDWDEGGDEEQVGGG